MQTVDLMERSPNRMGNLYTAERLEDISRLGVLDIIGALASWDVVKRTFGLPPIQKSLTKAGSEKSITFLKYCRCNPGPSHGQIQTLTVNAIQPKNFAIARDIARTCKRLNIACVYMQGPVYSRVCETSGRFMDVVLDRIHDSGLRVIRRTYCLPWSDVGDTIAHVLPAKKSFYSAKIFEAVRPFLEDASVMPRKPSTP